MITGLFVGKFLPPHKGHKFAILDAKKQCDTLYLVVGYEPNVTKILCERAGIPLITLEQKLEWWREELKGESGIIILGEDETGIPDYPAGWEEWSRRTQNLVREHIDFVFGSEMSYAEYYKKYFPNSRYVLQDVERKNVHISSTRIREDISTNLDYIIDSARPFFENCLKNAKK